MKINTDCIILKDDNKPRIEERMNAKFVCETCIKNQNGQWVNQPFCIFYTEQPHPQGSNYFAVYYDRDMNVMICDGITATEGEFQGVVGTDGIIYYSRYRHDFRNIPGGFVDGGRDYLRYGGSDMGLLKVVNLKIVGANLVPIIEGEANTVIYLEDLSNVEVPTLA